MTNKSGFQFSVIRFSGCQIQHSAFRIQRFLALGAWLLLLFIAGCQRSSDVLVEGTVTYDGQPVEMGAISFVPTVAGEQSQGAAITNGKFSAMVRPGAKRVEIRASRPQKPDPRDPNASSLREDYIPAKFNSASTLTAEISAEQENDLTFDLTEK